MSTVLQDGAVHRVGHRSTPFISHAPVPEIFEGIVQVNPFPYPLS
jgi:hypothetical protein